MFSRPSLASGLALLGASVLSAAVLSSGALAQEDYTPPRTWDGVPDLQGVWRNATVTPLTRPRELGTRQAYTREEAFRLERAAQQAVEEDNEPLDPNRPPPPAEDLPPVGNYDLFWTDRGMFMPTINGEFRTSIIIDPPDGQMPAYTEEFLEPHAGVMNKWLGASIGRWEGDTLVVETRHFNPWQNFRGASENLTVTETFRRESDHKIIYSFTVDDPTVFESSFTGELALTAYDDPLFEYAGHEGNYALAGTLAGARLAEEEARKAAEESN